MILLYQFPGAWGLPNISPFCMKTENYLRMTKVEFRSKTVLDPRTAPKGKLPYIDDAGTIIADSQRIIEHLKRKHGDPLDGHLSESEVRHGHMVRRFCEEALYFVALYSRWIDDVGWSRMQADVFGALPPIVRTVVPRFARLGVRKQLDVQGIGRQTRSDIYATGCADIDALAATLGDRDFILGDKPTSFDAVVYAFVAQILVPPIVNGLRARAESHKNLGVYCDRMKSRFY